MLTTWDKTIVALGALVVGVCAAAGVDASRVVEVLVGLALVVLPVVIYYVQNQGLTYTVISKFIAALPAALGGVFLLFNIDVTHELEQIGQQLLVLVPLLVAAVGNGAAHPVEDRVSPAPL